MGWRYRRRLRLARGLYLNLGKSGITSISAGVRGARHAPPELPGEASNPPLRRRMPLGALIVALALAAVACAGKIDDPGPYPDSYEQIIKDWLHTHLKDPYSIRDLSIGHPMEGSVWTGLLYHGAVPAWRSCTRLNSKNSYGAYTGIKGFEFYIRDGEVVYSQEGAC
jgi:hypothetical protein